MNPINRNRLANTQNAYQNFDKFPRLLACCSTGLLRSPTVAYVLSQEPYNFNVRACGLSEEYALIPIDGALLTWADLIVVMDGSQVREVKNKIEVWNFDGTHETPIFNFKIPDNFDYRDPKLVELIKKRVEEYELIQP